MALVELALIGGVLYFIDAVAQKATERKRAEAYAQQFDPVTGRRIPKKQPQRKIEFRGSRGHQRPYIEVNTGRDAELRENLPHRIRGPAKPNEYQNGIPMSLPLPLYEPHERVNHLTEINTTGYIRGLNHDDHQERVDSLKYHPSRTAANGGAVPSLADDGRVIDLDMIPHGLPHASMNALEKREFEWKTRDEAVSRHFQGKTDVHGVTTAKGAEIKRRENSSETYEMSGPRPSIVSLQGQHIRFAQRQLFDKPLEGRPTIHPDVGTTRQSDPSKHGQFLGREPNRTRLLTTFDGTLRQELGTVPDFIGTGSAADTSTFYYIGNHKRDRNIEWDGNSVYNAKSNTMYVNGGPASHVYYDSLNRPNVLGKVVTTDHNRRGTRNPLEIDSSRDFKYTRVLQKTLSGRDSVRPVKSYDQAPQFASAGHNANLNFVEDKRYRDMEVEMSLIDGLTFTTSKPRTVEEHMRSSDAISKLPVFPLYVNGI